MNGPDPPLTTEQQELFNTVMCGRLAPLKGAKGDRLYTFTRHSNRMLGHKLLHWRGLTIGQAQRVMTTVVSGYPNTPVRTPIVHTLTVS